MTVQAGVAVGHRCLVRMPSGQALGLMLTLVSVAARAQKICPTGSYTGGEAEKCLPVIYADTMWGPCKHSCSAGASFEDVKGGLNPYFHSKQIRQQDWCGVYMGYVYLAHNLFCILCTQPTAPAFLYSLARPSRGGIVCACSPRTGRDRPRIVRHNPPVRSNACARTRLSSV